MGRMRHVRVGSVAFAVLLLGRLIASERADAELVTATQLPLMPSCSAPHEWSADWTPRFVGSDVELSSRWSCRGLPAHVFVAQYAIQSPGKEAASGANWVMPRELRRIGTARMVEVGPITVSEMSIPAESSRQQ